MSSASAALPGADERHLWAAAHISPTQVFPPRRDTLMPGFSLRLAARARDRMWTGGIIAAARAYPIRNSWTRRLLRDALHRARTFVGRTRRAQQSWHSATPLASTHRVFGGAHRPRLLSYSLSMIPPWRDADARGFEVVPTGLALLIVTSVNKSAFRPGSASSSHCCESM